MGLLGSLSDDDKALGLLNLGAGMIAGNRGTSKGAAFQNAIGAGMGNYTNTLAMLGRQQLGRDELEQREGFRKAQEEALRQQMALRQAQMEAQQRLGQMAARIGQPIEGSGYSAGVSGAFGIQPKPRVYTFDDFVREAAMVPGGIEYAKAWREAQARRGYQDVGGQLLPTVDGAIDASGQPIPKTAAPSAPPEFIRMLEAAGIKQGTPQFDAAMGQYINKQTTHAPPVSVNNFPNPIPVIGSDGKPTLVQFGSKGEIRDTGLRPPVSAAERKAEQDLKKEGTRAQNAIQQSTMILGTIDSALGKVDALTSGVGGAVLGGIPGTQAYDLAREIDTIKANIGFDRLQQMREASPTGGALGQVAVQELNSLQATIASLDPRQSPSQLKQGLAKVRKHYGNWIGVMQQAEQGESPAAAPVKRYNPATGKIE